jgi:hypothetical protein
VRKSAIIIICIVYSLNAYTQKAVGMEQYYYWQQKTTGTIIPKVYYESPKKWYAEFRYNWEELHTASLHVGRQINFKKIPELTITPVAGVLFGKLTGGSAGTIIELQLNKFLFLSEPQYVFSFQQRGQNFFYSWSELSYQINSFSYAGFALQQTKLYDEKNFLEPGIMAGFNFGRFDIPLYCFSPTSASKNFVLGVNWRWEK